MVISRRYPAGPHACVVPVDMVVLCAAMEARQECGRRWGGCFGHQSWGADGFFLEEHPKLGPLNTATDGVFLAGTCQKPKRHTGHGGTGIRRRGCKALEPGGPGPGGGPLRPFRPNRSRISVSAASICIGLCPYGAIEFDARQGVSVKSTRRSARGAAVVRPICPSGAAQVSRSFQEKTDFCRDLTGSLSPMVFPEACTAARREVRYDGYGYHYRDRHRRRCNGRLRTENRGLCLQLVYLYTAADLAGTSRLIYPQNVRLIRVMCTGMVDPQYVIKAMLEGADGVLISGCHPGDCHYINGNLQSQAANQAA